MLEKQPGEGQEDNIASGEWEGQPAEFYTDRIVIKLNPPAEGERGQSFEDRYDSIQADIPGGAILHPPSPSGRLVAAVEPATDIPQLAAELSKRDDIAWAEPDVVDRAALSPTDPRFAAAVGAGRRSTRPARGTSRPAAATW